MFNMFNCFFFCVCLYSFEQKPRMNIAFDLILTFFAIYVTVLVDAGNNFSERIFDGS